MNVRNIVAKPTEELLASLDGTASQQFQAVNHPKGTEFWQLNRLSVHPDNPRNHTDTFAGIHVPSSIRAADMADSIQRIGDIVKPLTICGKGCKSKPGTILSGNRRYEGLELLRKGGKLPEILSTRGIPVDIKEGLTEADEMNILNDHGDTVPLNPTECFRAMLAMQASGYRPEEIVFRHPGLLAGYMQKQLDPLPADEQGRAAWYDKYRDTLTYNVLCWGFFPQNLLSAKVMAIQEEKESMYSKENPAIYDPFKPTAKRTKDLYKAMREDKKNKKWSNTGGPTFDTLVAKFTGEDLSIPEVVETGDATATVNSGLSSKEVATFRDAVGQGNPALETVLTYVETGVKPDGLHVAIKESAFAIGLARHISSPRARAFYAARLPAEIMAGIDQQNINMVVEAFTRLDAANEVKPA